jgi:hypothetical protein
MGAMRVFKMTDFLGQVLSGQIGLPNPSDAVTAAGDTDLDFDVDLSDLGNLASNYGMISVADWLNGDFDNDGDVDLSDLGSLATNYEAGYAQAFADFEAITGVPEPGSWMMIAGAGLLALARRRNSDLL